MDCWGSNGFPSCCFHSSIISFRASREISSSLEVFLHTLMKKYYRISSKGFFFEYSNFSKIKICKNPFKIENRRVNKLFLHLQRSAHGFLQESYFRAVTTISDMWFKIQKKPHPDKRGITCHFCQFKKLLKLLTPNLLNR